MLPLIIAGIVIMGLLFIVPLLFIFFNPWPVVFLVAVIAVSYMYFKSRNQKKR